MLLSRATASPMYSVSSLPRAVLRSFKPTCTRWTPTCRHASSKRMPRPSPARATTRARPDTVYPPTITSEATGLRLSPKQNQQIYAAKHLYDLGIRNVYTAPSPFGKLAASWLIGVMFVGYAAHMAYEGSYALRDGHGYGSIIRQSIDGGNKLVMIFSSLIGGYAVLRLNGLVKSLDLVRAGGVIQLRISVRRTIPFIKPKEFIVPSYELRLPHQWKSQSERQLHMQAPSTNRTLGRAIGLGYAKFKDFVFMDGLLAARFKSDDGTRNALLDTNGTFHRSMDDLAAMTHEVVPWER